MKKFSIFILILLVLAACGPSDNARDIAQAQSIIEAARATQDAAKAAQVASHGLSDVGRGQTLILVILSLVSVVLISLAVYIFIQRQLWKQSSLQPKGIGRWSSGPDAHWKRMDNPDPYQQILLQQQMILTQLLQQDQVDNPEDDRPQFPAGWWG